MQVKRLIGVVQQKPNLDFALTAREILIFHAAYFGDAHVARRNAVTLFLQVLLQPLLFVPPQQNLWVDSGSGSLPSV